MNSRFAKLNIIIIGLLTLVSCGGGDNSRAGTRILGSTSTPIGTISQNGSLYDVKYTVSGSATAASLTYQNGQGGTAQEDVSLPWEKTYQLLKGDFLYISAQNKADSGSITTNISVNGVNFKTTTSIGAFVIATSSGTCCE